MSRRTLDRRLRAPERRNGKGRGEMYVVELPEGMDWDAALAALGLTPAPADLVIIFPWGGKSEAGTVNDYAGLASMLRDSAR